MIEILLGSNTPSQLLALLFLGMLGSTVFIILQVDKALKKTKQEFQWSILFRENWLRLIMTPIFVYVFAICGNAIMQLPVVSSFMAGHPIYESVQLVYLVIGFYIDKIIAKLR